jgi:CHAT domain-containing protein
MSFYRALEEFQTLNDTSSTVFFGTWRVADAKVWLAKTMMMQERLQEAEIWAREALLENHPYVRPHALLILSEIYFGRERFEESRQLALTARNMVIDRCIAADALVRALAREGLARSLMAQGRWQEALGEFESIQKEMLTDPDTFNRKFGASADWGITLLANNHVDDALSFLNRALAVSKGNYGSGHFNTLELRALKGAATAEQGNAAAAMALFDEVMPQLVDRWSAGESDSTQQALRKQRALWILEAYIHLAGASGDRRKIKEAFAVVALIQSRKVGRSLSGSMARTKVNDPELASLIRQRQDLEMQLRYFESRLTSPADSSEGLSIAASSNESLLKEIGELNGAMEALDEEVRDRFPRYADVVDPRPMTPAETQAFLKPDEAMILVFVGRQRSFVWAFGDSGPVAFAEVAAGEAALAEQVARLREAVDPDRIETLDELPPYDVRLGHRLYRMLLDPVKAGWHSAKNLVVIAPYPLDQIPLAMLPTGSSPAGPDNGLPFSGYRRVPWLVRSHSVAVLPSVSSLRTLRTLAAEQPGRPTFAGFGDPWFSAGQANWQKKSPSTLASRGGIHRRGIRVAASGSLDDETLTTVDISMLQPLPDTAEEVLSIAETLGADQNEDVFLGQNASEGRLKTMDLNKRRILVFATHGLVPGDLDGLHQPALALSNPVVTGEPGDGLLTMGEVMELSLNADWVVLSACNTAAAEGAGAEALSGLGQAFFYAGARTLLLTSWPVETTSARLLTTELFRQQMMHPAAPRAVVLQRTMSRLIDELDAEHFSYAHPIFWAPFVLVGDGG